jgi:shikimate kinase
MNMSSIVLIGFMGTGKTAVGKKLAERLGLEFIDLDAVIEQRRGVTISEIFRRHGEPHFRRLEKEALAKVARRNDVVLAAGGGAVLDRENVEKLKKMGPVVHLMAGPGVIEERIAGQHHRPLMEVEDRRKQIENMLAVRLPFYAVADLDIDTSRLSVEEAAERIVTRLKESGMEECDHG